MLSRFAKSFIAVVFAMFLLTMVALIRSPSRNHWTGQLFGEGGLEGELHPKHDPPTQIGGVVGNVIMSKLGNETAKAALGRATWKLLHTMTLRFPEHPTADEREALNSYFHLSARLYPCGECAAEFQTLLQKFPPQTSSRRTASLWLCALHNQVNKRLKKPDFDCAHLSDEYDCGCGDNPPEIKKPAPPANSDSMDLESDPTIDDLTDLEMIRGGR